MTSVPCLDGDKPRVASHCAGVTFERGVQRTTCSVGVVGVVERVDEVRTKLELHGERKALRARFDQPRRAQARNPLGQLGRIRECAPALLHRPRHDGADDLHALMESQP